MDPYCVFKGNPAQRTRITNGLWEGFFINKKKEEIKNDIYLVLRPDKDEKSNKLFPGKKVVYLRYDKPEDLIMIERYNKL